jgi:Carbohydrate binding domain
MGTSHWKPLPTDLPAPARDLAARLRGLLDDDGLSLRQLAASNEIHYSVTTLHRYFSGQALPPRQLIEVLARRCGGDLKELNGLYERARAAGNGDPGGSETDGVPARQDPPRGRRRLVIGAAVVVLLGGAAFGIAAALAGDTPTVPPPARYELVVNGGFDSFDGKEFHKWWTTNTRAAPEGGAARVEVPGGTKQRWDVLFGQSGIRITAGREYVLTFTASADKAVQMGVTVQEERPPDYPQVYFKNVVLGPAPQSFTYRFTAERGAVKSQLVFQFGGGSESYTAFLDDLSLVELTP